MKSAPLTAALFAIGCFLQVATPRSDEPRALAEQMLGPVQRVPLPGPPAFRAGDRTVLFFECRGMSGPIHGAIVVSAQRISKVLILRSREGLTHTAFVSGRYLERFNEQSTAHPVVADAVSGATVSCQAVTDAVNRRLSVWRDYAGARS